MKKASDRVARLKSWRSSKIVIANKEADNDFVSVFRGDLDYLLLFEFYSQGSSTVRVRAFDDLESPRPVDEYAEPDVLLDAYPDDD